MNMLFMMNKDKRYNSTIDLRSKVQVEFNAVNAEQVLGRLILICAIRPNSCNSL